VVEAKEAVGGKEEVEVTAAAAGWEEAAGTGGVVG